MVLEKHLLLKINLVRLGLFLETWDKGTLQSLQLLCIRDYSKDKYEAICLTAKGESKFGQTTRQMFQSTLVKLYQNSWKIRIVKSRSRPHPNWNAVDGLWMTKISINWSNFLKKNGPKLLQRLMNTYNELLPLREIMSLNCTVK